MAQFTIELFEFALLVHRPVGLTVLFPAKSHALSLDIDGKILSIGAGSSIFLVDEKGAPLPAEATKVLNPDTFVFDMAKVVSKPVRVPVATLTGATVNAALINARVILSGGTLKELPKSGDPLTWVFDNGHTQAVTDSAEFTHPIGDNEKMHLVVNGTAFPILAGDRLRLQNQDVVGDVGEFVELEEFEALCGLTQAAGAPPPTRFRANADQKRFKMLGSLRVFEAATFFGGEFVCALASIASDD
jgi:hypothetical protein